MTDDRKAFLAATDGEDRPTRFDGCTFDAEFIRAELMMNGQVWRRFWRDPDTGEMRSDRVDGDNVPNRPTYEGAKAGFRTPGLRPYPAGLKPAPLPTPMGAFYLLGQASGDIPQGAVVRISVDPATGATTVRVATDADLAEAEGG